MFQSGMLLHQQSSLLCVLVTLEVNPGLHAVSQPLRKLIWEVTEKGKGWLHGWTGFWVFRYVVSLLLGTF